MGARAPPTYPLHSRHPALAKGADDPFKPPFEQAYMWVCSAKAEMLGAWGCKSERGPHAPASVALPATPRAPEVSPPLRKAHSSTWNARGPGTSPAASMPANADSAPSMLPSLAAVCSRLQWTAGDTHGGIGSKTRQLQLLLSAQCVAQYAVNTTVLAVASNHIISHIMLHFGHSNALLLKRAVASSKTCKAHTHLW